MVLRVNNSINLIIFSKNRACQLELLLRSISHFWNDEHICPNIIYKFDNEVFASGYNQLIAEFPTLNWFSEKDINIDFKELLLDIIDDKIPFTLFLTDDSVFINYLNLNCSQEFKNFKQKEYVNCLSLSLHPLINYSYLQNYFFVLPKPNEYGLFGSGNYKGEWEFPLTITEQIFRTDDILPKLQDFNYNNPTILEEQYIASPIIKDYMICFNESKIINIPSNKVQTVNHKRYANSTKVEDLNTLFLKEKRIDLTPFENIQYTSTHLEKEFIFV